jgi:hypothetical protein
MLGRRSPRSANQPAAARGRCTASGCRRRDGERCSYVDKRSRACPTSWCPDHAGLIGGLPFCRRHASTMDAIGGDESVAGLPDLDNRAPSLVGCVGAELDAPVRDLLTRIAPPVGATLVADPVRLVLTPGGRARRWAKAWKLVDSTAVLNRVSIEVDELDDSQVCARVDAELIGQGVPPWIAHRRAGDHVDPVTAAAERRDFAAAMARSIELVVTHQEVVPRP